MYSYRYASNHDIRYIYIHKIMHILRSAIIEMVGKNPIESPDYGRIINDRHMARLAEVIGKMSQEKLVLGGDYDNSLRFIGKFNMWKIVLLIHSFF